MVLSNELILPLLAGVVLDAIMGDPERMPHPVVGFGKAISWGEKRLNRGKNRLSKGVLLTLLCVGTIYLGSFALLKWVESLSEIVYLILTGIIVFFCLAAHTLIKEVRNVNRALKVSLDKGRTQVGRIVGRDTSNLNAHQIDPAPRRRSTTTTERDAEAEKFSSLPPERPTSPQSWPPSGGYWPERGAMRRYPKTLRTSRRPTTQSFRA